MTNAKRITIFEGPDGGGKSTAAAAFAAETDAALIHHGPYPREGAGLWKVYARSMEPAIKGERDVVLDRSWISEPIYGDAFRGGACRIDLEQLDTLETLKSCARSVVVICIPPWETCLANYLSRKEEELLDNEDQLRAVYRMYHAFVRERLFRRGFVHYDYTDSTGFSRSNGRVKPFFTVEELDKKRARAVGDADFGAKFYREVMNEYGK